MTAIVKSKHAMPGNETGTLATKKYLLVALVGVVLFGIGFLVEFKRGSSYLSWTSACIAFNIYTTYALFSNRKFAIATLALFLTYGVTVVWMTNYLLGLPMSSWRAGWESGFEFPEALGVTVQYLTYFGILANAALSMLPPSRTEAFKPLGKDYGIPVLALAAASGLTLIAIAGTQARDQYLLDADIGSMFLVQASSIMIAVLFAFSMFFMEKGPYRNQMNVVLIGIALVVGANGFRFIIVVFAFIGFFYLLSTRKFSVRWVVAVTLGTVVGYLFLLILAYTRAVGMTFGEALAFAVQPDFDAAFRYIGGADQANIVAQDYYYWRRGNLLYGQTYLDAFLRLAPNVVHTTFFDTLRAQDYIIDTGTFIPDVFRQNNWTMGSHLFIEAIINFGRTGPYIMLTVFVAALALLEKWCRTSYTLFLGYVVMASMGYSLAWYGFANSLKQGVFAFACGAIVILIGKLFTKGGALPRTRGRQAHFKHRI